MPSRAIVLLSRSHKLRSLRPGAIDGRAFFKRNHFTAGLERLVRLGFDRLAGRGEDGAFYLTQAMGGGKTHKSHRVWPAGGRSRVAARGGAEGREWEGLRLCEGGD